MTSGMDPPSIPKTVQHGPSRAKGIGSFLPPPHPGFSWPHWPKTKRSGQMDRQAGGSAINRFLDGPGGFLWGVGRTWPPKLHGKFLPAPPCPDPSPGGFQPAENLPQGSTVVSHCGFVNQKTSPNLLCTTKTVFPKSDRSPKRALTFSRQTFRRACFIPPNCRGFKPTLSKSGYPVHRSQSGTLG